MKSPLSGLLNDKVFQFSFSLPIGLGLILSILTLHAEKLYLLEWSFVGSDVVSTLLLFQVPLGIIGLSLPLGTLASLNYRSAQTGMIIKQGEEKRLREIYYEGARHFEDTFGRQVETHRWQYVERDDLVNIYRLMYKNMLVDGSLDIDHAYFDNLVEHKDILKKMCYALREQFLSADEGGKLLVVEGLFNMFEHRSKFMSVDLGFKPFLRSSNLSEIISSFIEIPSLLSHIVTISNNSNRYCAESLHKEIHGIEKVVNDLTNEIGSYFKESIDKVDLKFVNRQKVIKMAKDSAGDMDENIILPAYKISFEDKLYSYSHGSW